MTATSFCLISIPPPCCGILCGPDGLTKENVIYAHPSVVIHLKILFNIISGHGFVPDNFGLSVTVPVVKDKTKDVCSADNYRPIALSPVISKIFEYCILNKFEYLSQIISSLDLRKISVAPMLYLYLIKL